MPRRGHLKRGLQIFGYLKHYQKGQIRLDPNKPDMSYFKNTKVHDWTEFYPDATEEFPDNAPKGIHGENGEDLITFYCYVDSNHAHCMETRKSVTGILLFANKTPIKSYCKQQNTVESSTYSSEMVAGRIATKLISYGIPIQTTNDGFPSIWTILFIY